MSVKDKLNSAKLWQSISGALITAVASYFGYTEIQSREASHDVEVTVEVPAPVKHTHKDWTDAYERADQRAMDKHRDALH